MTQQAPGVNLGLPRRGRPPKIETVGNGSFALNIRGTQLRFSRTSTGWFKLTTRDYAPLNGDDVNYARAVLGRSF